VMISSPDKPRRAGCLADVDAVLDHLRPGD
jgi:hypothetical protein